MDILLPRTLAHKIFLTCFVPGEDGRSLVICPVNILLIRWTVFYYLFMGFLCLPKGTTLDEKEKVAAIEKKK